MPGLLTDRRSILAAMGALALCEPAHALSGAGKAIAAHRGGLPPLSAINGVSNFTRANTTAVRSAKLAMLAGSDDFRVAYAGDSTALGCQSNGSLYAGILDNNVMAQVAASLNTAGIPASQDSLWGEGNSTSEANFISMSSRITASGTGWASGGFASIGGSAYGITGADTTSTLTWATAKSCDTMDVWFLKFSSGGSFKVSVDGGAEGSAQSTAGGTSSFGKLTVSLGSSGTHTVRLRCSTSNVFIIGVTFYNTTARRAVLWTHGREGAQSTALVATADAPWDWGNTYASTNAHLTILQGGMVNDRGSVSTPATQFIPNMQTLITGLKAAGQSVWLLNSYPLDTSVAGAYQTATKALAVTNNIPCIDVMWQYNTLALWTAHGFLSSDSTHPTGSGYGYIAAFISAMLEAL